MIQKVLSPLRYFKDSLREWLERGNLGVTASAVPQALQVEITTRCNFGCAHCPRNTSGARVSSKDMDLGFYGKLIEQTPPPATVCLYGQGEPLVHPDFFRMVRIAKRAGAKVSFNSNGALIDNYSIDAILAHGVDQILFSIDGAVPGTYRSVRPSGNLAQILDNLRLLSAERTRRASSLRLSVCFTCYASNFEDIPSMVGLASELGFDEVHYQNMVPWDAADSGNCVFNIEPALLRKKYRRALHLAEEKKIRITRIPNVEFDRVPRYRVCRIPWQCLYIRADGMASACNVMTYESPCQWYFEKGLKKGLHHIYPYLPGDAAKNSVRGIWNGEAMQRLRAAHLAGAPPEPCDRCFLVHMYH